MSKKFTKIGGGFFSRIFQPPGSQAQSRLVLTDGGWMDDGWVDGQAKSIKITYFENFLKTTRYFFQIVSRPLRRVFKTFSEKNSKKIKKIKFVQKFRTIFFQRFLRFFDVCSRVDLVNFLEVFSSGVLEEISLFTFFLDSS